MTELPGADDPFCYLTTTGRRSGRPHTVEMWFAASGRTLYALAGGRERADWVRNLRADPAVEVHLAGVRYPATAREVDAGSGEDAEARRLLLEKYQEPGSSDLEQWGRTALAVAFDLDPRSS